MVAFTLGILVLFFNAVLMFSDTTLRTGPVAVMVLLFACIAFSKGPKVRRGTEFIEYRFWDYPMLVGLVLAPSYAVATVMILTYGLLSAYTYVTTPEKRLRLPVHFGVVAVAISLGCAIAELSEPWTYPVGYMLLMGLVELGMLGYDLTRGDHDYALRAFRDDLSKRLLIPLTSSLIVTAMVYSIGPERIFVVFAPLSLLLLYWGTQARMEAVEQQSAWRHMESISSKFIGELEEHKAITVALEESLKLFSARHAEILLPGTLTEAGSRWTLDDGPRNAVEVDVLPPTAEDPTPPEETRNTRVIPLSVGERNFGYMIIEWDPHSPDKKARKNLTKTFGHSVAASISTTRHNKHVSNQAAEKAREAERDPLTGLGNRSMLAERGPSLLAEAADIHRKCALLLFDLDGFKRINDTLGHAAGDQVLVEVSRRIQETTRKNDLAIRLGGDEFAVLAVDMEMAADAERLASKIARALIPPVEVGDLHLSVESSIGVAMYPDDAEEIESLLQLADIAMYEAKAHGRGMTVRYSPEINYNTTEALMLTTELRRAIVASDELVLHYQPQLDLATDRIVGVEALVRWNHPRLGLLYPDKFVPIAERSNLVRPFTLAIVQRAIADRVLMRDLLPDGTVSVNLSAQNLLDTGLADDIRRALENTGVKPSEVVLEVTETTTAKDVLAADRVLRELSGLGCAIAMDDFGSGYATMESLRSGSPINEIKIDRGFIADIAVNDRDRRVARAIVEIAHAWNCRVVAEGVEDEQTYRLLADMGCDAAQGYWMHKPAPLGVILDWAKSRTEPSLSHR